MGRATKSGKGGRRRLLALTVLILLLIAVAVAAAVRVRERLQPVPVPPGPPLAVETLELQPRPFTVSRRYTGVLEARRRALISARVTAQVLEVPHREGEPAAEGDLLVRLDAIELRQELERLQAAERRIEAELSYWRGQLHRDEQLLAKGTVAERSRDESARQVQMLEASLKENRAGQAIAHTRIGYAEIHAPFAGTVQAVQLEPGELATPGKPLLELVADDDLKAVVPMPQSDVPLVRVGLPASLRLPGGRSASAPVARLYPAMDPGTHTATLEIAVPAGLVGAKPGMEVDAEVLLEETAASLVVPRQALRERKGQTGVFLAEGDSARWRSVVAGAGGARELRISEGLKPGDRLILTPDPRLEDGRALWIAPNVAGDSK
ncbi:MAG: efflux RND transporter periplasmic adaptor subunit [Pseudomonadota bacterium]|nr:efflux RND transporter periplasmic adaptor subunit [Pseudomonadota bacterium]